MNAFPWRALQRLAVVLALGALVHLGVVLALGGGRDRAALEAVTALGQGAPELATIAGAAATARFPFDDPALAASFCVYDLRKGPVTVRLPVDPLDFAALSVHGPRGEASYALTNDAAVGGAIILQLGMGEGAPPAGEEGGAVRVKVAEPEGFVAAEALAAMPSLRPAAAETVSRLSCRREP